MDKVYWPKKNITGQIYKIIHNKVTILFVTDDRLTIDREKIIWKENRWRIND